MCKLYRHTQVFQVCVCDYGTPPSAALVALFALTVTEWVCAICVCLYLLDVKLTTKICQNLSLVCAVSRLCHCELCGTTECVEKLKAKYASIIVPANQCGCIWKGLNKNVFKKSFKSDWELFWQFNEQTLCLVKFNELRNLIFTLIWWREGQDSQGQRGTFI